MALQRAKAAFRQERGAPLYHRIFLVLRDGIRTGTYAPGQALPTEEQLATIFGVSRVTVRGAIAGLQDARLVVKRHGVGTFVAFDGRHCAVNAPDDDVLAHIRRVGRTTRIKLLEYGEAVAPLAVRGFFGSGNGARFRRVVRVRSLARRPIFHVVAFLTEACARGLTRKQLASRPLHDLFADRGIELVSGKQVVSAVLAEPAAAEALRVPVGAPLLQLRRFHYDQNGAAVLYVEVLASPEAFELHMTLDPPDFN